MSCKSVVGRARAALVTGVVVLAGTPGVRAQAPEPSMTTGALFGRNFACMITNHTDQSIRVVFETIDFRGELIDSEERSVKAGESFALRDNSTQERFQYCRFAFPGLGSREFRRAKDDLPAAICVREIEGCQGTLIAR